MSFFDAAFDIGKTLVSSSLGGGSVSNTVIAPTYGSSLIQPLSGADSQKSPSLRRGEEATQIAETTKEKGLQFGDDPIALALMWDEFFKEGELDGQA